MELVSMKRTKKEVKQETKPYVVPSKEVDAYPYNLTLSLYKEQTDKISNASLFKVGDKIIFQAEAEIVEVRSTEKVGGEESRTMEIQLQSIGFEAAKKPLNKMNMREYRAEREKSK